MVERLPFEVADALCQHHSIQFVDFHSGTWRAGQVLVGQVDKFIAESKGEWEHRSVAA